MLFPRSLARSALLATLCALSVVACKGDPAGDDSGKSGKGPHGSSGGDDRDGGDPFGNATVDARVPLGDGGSPNTAYELTPQSPQLNGVHGEDPPSVQFEVMNGLGQSVPARYELDNAELGTIDEFGLFTAFGTRGGTVDVEARVGDRLMRTTITVLLSWEQNGGTDDVSGSPSSGGRGGVGGEGPGVAVSDELKQVLDGKAESDASLKLIYPYDDTVMPLGLLPPLLMWSVPDGGAVEIEGVMLHLSGLDFEYRGYFGRPEALAADAAFVRHPIPEDVWESATHSVAGTGLTIELTFAKGGVAYGPISTGLRIAAGTLKGTVYYQSYGTNLAKNYDGAKGGDGRFGGATLAIKPGAVAPVLVAGGNGGHDQCRVCHSVSSDGSRMTVQHGDDYDRTSSYDLRNGYAETAYPTTSRSLLAWTGLSPDGAYALGNSVPLGIDTEPVTALYDMTTGDVVATTGLADFVERAALPAFSHDGLRVAFNFYSGPGNAGIGPGDGKKLVAMDFDPMAMMFGNPQLLYQGDAAAGWPTFSPTGNGVIFEVEAKRGDEGRFFYTRHGGQGELWWTSLRTGEAHKLEHVNGTDMGTSYLPQADNNHKTDELLNYEPSIAPIASGGYAWVVFTSRRMYGNVATIDPWFSDPRDHDLTQTPTTKKLWVAAIDLDVDTPELSTMVGDDPSHPAFYLPGQELLAGNTRGFWSVDPCKADGVGCESGVDCCSGFCQKDDASDELTCGRKMHDCSNEFDHCETRSDCCDQELLCINHVCSRVVVQ